MTNPHVSPGTKLKQSPLRMASVVNDVLDAAEDYRRRRLGEGGGGRNLGLPTDLVKVKNATGTALRAGEIVEINGSPLTPLSRANPWFTAAVPNETRPFAVLLEDVPSDANAIGLAQVSGCCPALVNLSATTDLWAFVSDTLDVLQGDRFWGDVRILWQPGSTGEQLCWVNFEKSPQDWLCKINTAPLNKGSSGTVKVFAGTPGSEADTTFTITSCYNRTVNITSVDTWCTAFRLHRKKYIAPLECT